jgi:hypothetical protein
VFGLGQVNVTASMLVSMQPLTFLELGRDARLEFAAFAHMPWLQHLRVWAGMECHEKSEPLAVTAGLLKLQRLTELTHLCILFRGYHPQGPPGDPANAVYSALTASSKLQYLEVCADTSMSAYTCQVTESLPAH